MNVCPLVGAAAAASVFLAATATAQYPAQPIRLIVPIPPGGGPDIVARMLGQKLGEVFHQPVIVEPPGSNGVIGAELTARAAPDGYMPWPEGDRINPHLYSRMSFNPLDLAPVAAFSAATRAVGCLSAGQEFPGVHRVRARPTRRSRTLPGQWDGIR
jgi:tripartite-type tricarboxylate transporter receptor subunit TctC